jgi:hypothetical protein
MQWIDEGGGWGVFMMIAGRKNYIQQKVIMYD